MFSAAMRVLHIKDLKDLSFFASGGTIDMQDLKDLKRCLSFATVWGMREIAGDRPPRYEGKRPEFVGRGPVPRHATIAGDRPPRYGMEHANDRGGQAPALRLEKPPPFRATVGKALFPNQHLPRGGELAGRQCIKIHAT